MDGTFRISHLSAGRSAREAYSHSPTRGGMNAAPATPAEPPTRPPAPVAKDRPYGLPEPWLRILAGRGITDRFLNRSTGLPETSDATARNPLSGAGAPPSADGEENAGISREPGSAGDPDDAEEIPEAGDAKAGPKQEADSLGRKPGQSSSADGEALSEQEVRLVRQLQSLDAKVRAHEQAHLSAAGGLATGGAHFEYQSGPDDRRYAVGGEVQIDTSEARTSEATVQKMQGVRAAALAPANPSTQDRRVASLAAQREMQARQEMMLEAEQRERLVEASQPPQADSAEDARATDESAPDAQAL